MTGLERIEKALNSKEDKLWRTWKLWINPTYSPKITKVESVKKIGESGVYDITVEPYPRFIAELIKLAL